jgi:hypothetical protein
MHGRRSARPQPGLAPADLARIMAEAGDKVLMVHTSLLSLLLSAVLPAVP